MSGNFKWPVTDHALVNRSTRDKVLAALNYILLHKKQLSTAFALGAGLLETIQKAH